MLDNSLMKPIPFFHQLSNIFCDPRTSIMSHSLFFLRGGCWFKISTRAFNHVHHAISVSVTLTEIVVRTYHIKNQVKYFTTLVNFGKKEICICYVNLSCRFGCKELFLLDKIICKEYMHCVIYCQIRGTNEHVLLFHASRNSFDDDANRQTFKVET